MGRAGIKKASAASGERPVILAFQGGEAAHGGLEMLGVGVDGVLQQTLADGDVALL
jgi:hypothetical protein